MHISFFFKTLKMHRKIVVSFADIDSTTTTSVAFSPTKRREERGKMKMKMKKLAYPLFSQMVDSFAFPTTCAQNG